MADSAMATSKLPLPVSSTIAVVSVRVWPLMLPPTIMEAPISEITPPKPAMTAPIDATAEARAAAGRTLATYARALEANDLHAVEWIYPRITDRERAAWKKFFEVARDLSSLVGGAGVDPEPEAQAEGALAEVLGEHPRRHQPERIVVGTRTDGADHLVRLGGGEDELDVRRRLLQRLEEGIERRRRQHVDFIDDKDFVSVTRRAVANIVNELSNLIDATIGGRVHLHHVGVAPFHDLDNQVPQEVKASMEQIHAGLLDGSIETSVPSEKP